MDEVSKLKAEVANLNYRVYQLTCALNRRTYELECACVADGTAEIFPHSKLSESGVCIEPYCGWPYHTHALTSKSKDIQEVKAVPVETVNNLVTACAKLRINFPTSVTRRCWPTRSTWH